MVPEHHRHWKEMVPILMLMLDGGETVMAFGIKPVVHKNSGGKKKKCPFFSPYNEYLFSSNL